ncbi:MAG: hypothetical protein ACFCAD_26400 [Pleurocapsa sp.]
MIINGTPENDNFTGTADNDTITGLNGDDFLSGVVGDDSILGGIGDDTLNGGAGNDTLRGGVGNNVINGGIGNDLIIFDVGENSVNGGAGNDTLRLNFVNNTENIVFTYNIFADPSPTTEGILEGTTVQSIERVDFSSGSGDDLIDIATASLGSLLSGGLGDDSLIGGLGNDTLDGEAGNDTFFGGSGNDRIIGGEDNDAAVFLGLASRYEVVLGETLTSVTGAAPATPPAEGSEEDVANIPEPESFTDILSEVEIILFDNGEIIVETGEFIAFEPDSPDSEEVPLITEGDVEEDNGEDDIPVYRFFRTDTQTQFYTTEEVERDVVLETLPQYELEGISFVGVAPPAEEEDITGISPVYRFFNTSTGVHLYTADENEKTFVEENLDNYVAEGTPYYGYDTQVEGTIPLYRFYNESLDAHFYTPSIEERDIFIESPDYEPEGSDTGIAFYVEPAPEVL